MWAGSLLALTLVACDDPARENPTQPLEAGAPRVLQDAARRDGPLTARPMRPQTDRDAALAPPIPAHDASEAPALDAGGVLETPRESGDEGVDAGAGALDASVPFDLDCRGVAPALAFDVLAVVQGSEWVLRRFDDDAGIVVAGWSAGFRPSPPVAFTAGSGSAFALALSNGRVCRVHAVDREGAALWTLEREAARCVSPSPSEAGLWLPLAHADGTGTLERIDPNDGTVLGSTALPSAPTTALAALGGGGSHWIAGSERGVLLVAGPAGGVLGVTNHELDGLAPVVELAVVASDRLVVASERNLGRYSVDLDEAVLEPLGAPIEAAGPITSNLVASLDCGDLAGGGTHYFCEGGLVAAGGAGWMSAWRIDDGESWFGLSVPDTVQGLALLADGSLYGGGSHWTGGEGGVSLYAMRHPGAPLELVHSRSVPDESCAASPVVDTDGTLALSVASRVASELVTVATRAPGLASGWSRANGDNGSRATLTDQSDTCDTGDVRLFQRFAGPELGHASDVATFPDGAFVVAGGGDGAVLAGFSPAGVQEWSHTLPDAPQFDRIAASDDRVFAFALRSDSLEVRVLARDGAVLAEQSEPMTGLSLVGAHALGDGRVVVVAALAVNDPLAADALLFVFSPDGALVGEAELIDAAVLVPSASARVPGSSDLVLTGAVDFAGGFAARVTLEGALVWFDSVETARPDLFGVDVLVDADGVATVAFANGQHTLLHRYDALGSRGITTPYAFVVPKALAADETGSWLLDQSGGVSLVLDQLTLAPVRARPEAPSVQGLALEAGGAGVLLVANATEADGSGSVLLARLDSEARSGCARAGLCVSAESCAAEGACQANTCEPSTGQCIAEPAPELSSCGADDVCYEGSCGPVPPGVDAPRTLQASSCYDVASYAECVPFGLSYATLVLHGDGTIDTMDATATGTWREPAGPDSIEFEFRSASDGSLMSTFTGQRTFDRCWEGTIASPDGLSGVFRACGT